MGKAFQEAYEFYNNKKLVGQWARDHFPNLNDTRHYSYFRRFYNLCPDILVWRQETMPRAFNVVSIVDSYRKAHPATETTNEKREPKSAPLPAVGKGANKLVKPKDIWSAWAMNSSDLVIAIKDNKFNHSELAKMAEMLNIIKGAIDGQVKVRKSA